MIALSTACAGQDDLAACLTAFHGLEAEAAALHRPARREEAPALAALARRWHYAAVFGAGGADVGCRLVVLEGGPAGTDRERSLEELCRRIHALRGARVALRTPLDPAHHPSPAEIGLIASEVKGTGYWHEEARGGLAHLAAAGGHLLGASFDPLLESDLVALREALPAAAPKVILCRPGAPLAEALRIALGIFRG